MTRQETLDAIRENPEVSVLIIGGGINGIGTFRDLALQDLDVLMVEKSDFSSGASAASSHMAHGGLRYLENGEFRLVSEALMERNRLLVNAPHYVKPLPTTIPIFSWFSGMLNAPLKFIGLLDKPSQRGAIIIKLGLTFYDLVTRRNQVMPRHRLFSRKESLERRPQLNPDIVATATYYDAWMPYPERIALELVLDAEATSPQARALNYVEAVGAGQDYVEILDRLSGEKLTVKPKVVINAAGPWIDFANDALGRSSRFIGGTKGSHLIVDNKELYDACQGQELFFENKDGRITLFFPLEDRVLIGTTDIRIDDPDDAICTEEEVDYMLDFIRVVFPDINVSRDDIVFRFSGVRPLPAVEAGSTGQISRDHSIRTIEAGVRGDFPILSLVGGKWTTFRAFSEQVTDNVLQRLKKSRKGDTKQLPIGGGKDYPREDGQRWLSEHQASVNVSRERLETLLHRYGTRALEVIEYCEAGEDAPLETLPNYTRCEIMFVSEKEKVIHLDDVLLRRSLLAMLGKVDDPAIDEIARYVAEALGWDAERIRQEKDNTRKLLQEKHFMKL